MYRIDHFVDSCLSHLSTASTKTPSEQSNPNSEKYPRKLTEVMKREIVDAGVMAREIVDAGVMAKPLRAACTYKRNLRT
jgi:hypothetical protein